jgi:hypothetical protein|eukprot:COSAG01_NODE_5432_length_4265_cov_142.429189_4_plen_161_part_00
MCCVFLSQNNGVETPGAGEHANGGACVLPDGRVFVCGGYGGGRSAEVYDAASDSWTLLASMRHPRTGGRYGCSALSVGGGGGGGGGGGDVMVVGGHQLRSCEVLDTVDNTAEVLEEERRADEREEAVPVAAAAAEAAQAAYLLAVDAVRALVFLSVVHSD